MIYVFGASYFFERDPNQAIIVLHGSRDPDGQIEDFWTSDVEVEDGTGLKNTNWISLVVGKDDQIQDPPVHNYGQPYSEKRGFIYVEYTRPVEVGEAKDGKPLPPPSSSS